MCCPLTLMPFTLTQWQSERVGSKQSLTLFTIHAAAATAFTPIEMKLNKERKKRSQSNFLLAFMFNA